MRTIPLLTALLLPFAAACQGAAHDPPQPVTPIEPMAPVEPQIPVAPASALWPATVTVPETWTCGDLPPEAERVIVAVDGAGAISVDGVAMDWGRMVELLGDRSASLRPAGQSKWSASPLHVVLALDASLPWSVAQHCLQSAATAQVFRTYFAVTPSAGGEPGAFALYLPQDRGLSATISNVLERPKRVVRVRSGWPPTDPMGLHDILAADLTEHPHVEFEVDAKPAARVRLVLRLLDIAATQGVTRASVLGVPGSVGPEGLAPVIAASPKPVRQITVPGREMRGAPLLIPVADRVHGAYAGFAERPPMPPEEEKPLELEEPPR